MSSDYDKIRADNIREYGEGTRHLSFLGRLYTDRTHFIFELLQNAEDAGATKILFQLSDGMLIVRHDGRPFDEFDVKGVCGVGEGTKAEDLTQIGKFGIGFKSVYAYTSTPEVHSGGEHFRIEHYVRPYPVDPKEAGDSWTTLFSFTFNIEQVEAGTAFREIAARLRNLSARTLLFLRKIKEIEYKLSEGTGGVYLREEIPRGPGRQVTVIGQNNGEEEDENWLVFEKPVPVPDSYDPVKVEVAFKLSTDAKETTERITRIMDAPLVVYFPTEKLTRFGFLIQGPYRTTPSRDNIPKDDEWNATLVEKTAALLIDALQNIKEMGLLTVSLLESMPIRMDDFPEDSMFFPITTSIRNALLDHELLPADGGTFVDARNAKLARGGELRKLLSQEQLRSLFQSRSDVKWLAGTITQDRTPDLRAYLMNELDVEEITPDGFARRLSEPFLYKQSDGWFPAFYKYLSGQEALWRPTRWTGDTIGVLRNKPILRLQDNTHVKPFRSDSTPNAFLPPPEDTDLPIVKREIFSEEQTAEFLSRLGLSEPDVFDDIVERVLPKYSVQNASSISQHEHSMDIQKILRAMLSDSEAGKKKVARTAKGTPFLQAIDQNGSASYKKPIDIYSNDENIRLYFDRTKDVWFLDEKVDGNPVNSDIWINLGVAIRPRRMLFSGGLPPEEREYSTRSESIENYDLHGLSDFLDELSSLPEFEEQKQRSLILWNYLRENLEANPRFFMGRYQWFYYSSHYKTFESRMLVRLRESEWIPTKNQVIELPRHVTVSQLCEELAASSELIESLGIRLESKTNETIQEKNQYAVELGVSLEDIELLKNNPEEFQQWKAAISAKKKKPVFPKRSSSNPERRREKLAEQLGDSPNKEYEQRDRSVRTTRGAVDPVSWLINQYKNDAGQMICQICKEEMPFRKRDGEYYFEAVEALSKDHFSMEHEAQFLALCPLCAAMYKEFVKPDEVAMAGLINVLMNADEYEVPLGLGALNTSIQFVETHFQDIKTILENAD